MSFQEFPSSSVEELYIMLEDCIPILLPLCRLTVSFDHEAHHNQKLTNWAPKLAMVFLVLSWDEACDTSLLGINISIENVIRRFPSTWSMEIDEGTSTRYLI